jgi:WD40 repeat protein
MFFAPLARLLPGHKLDMFRLFTKRGLHFTLALVFALAGLIVTTDAQKRSVPRPPNDADDVVFAIAFSPDGSTLAIARGAGDPAQRYGRIELWDTNTGKLRHTIKGFEGPVRSISFSPDGHTLISGSSEHLTRKIQEKTRSFQSMTRAELKWWDAQTGELKQKVTLPGEHIYSLRAAYSPDGQQIALAESSYAYTFFETDSGYDPLSRARGAFPGPTMPIGFLQSELKLLDARTGDVTLKLDSTRSGTIVFSPDGMLVAKENGKDIRVWNVQTGHEEHRLKGFKGEPNTIAFSPDGQSLAVAVTRYYHEDAGRTIKIIGSSEVEVFDVRTWKMTLQLQNVGMVNSLAYDPGGTVLLIGGLIHEQEDATPGVKLWNLQSGKTANFHTGAEDFSQAVDSLAISRNGGMLAFRSGADTVELLDTRTWKVINTFDKNSDPDNERPASRFLLTLSRVTSLGFSPDGNSLSGQIEGNGIKRWDPRTGELRRKVADQEGNDAMVEVSADGNSAAGAGNDGTLHFWDLISGARHDLHQPSPSATALSLSHDGRKVAVAYPNRIMIVNSATGEAGLSLDSRLTKINRMTFSTDGEMLAAAGDGEAIMIWKLGDGQLLKTIAGAGNVTALCFSTGNRKLASANEDGTVTLWDLQTGGLLGQLKKHSATVNAIAFSADGTLMATGGDDRSVIIWEAATGKARRTIKGHDLSVTSLAFSPDGTLLASGEGNASVALWEVRTGELNRVLK